MRPLALRGGKHIVFSRPPALSSQPRPMEQRCRSVPGCFTLRGHTPWPVLFFVLSFFFFVPHRNVRRTLQQPITGKHHPSIMGLVRRAWGSLAAAVGCTLHRSTRCIPDMSRAVTGFSARFWFLSFSSCACPTQRARRPAAAHTTACRAAGRTSYCFRIPPPVLLLRPGAAASPWTAAGTVHWGHRQTVYCRRRW